METKTRRGYLIYAVPYTIYRLHIGWMKNGRKCPFAVPMILCEPTNLISECFFYMNNISHFPKKTKAKIVYAECKSALKLVLRDFKNPDRVPISLDTLEYNDILQDKSFESPINEEYVVHSKVNVSRLFNPLWVGGIHLNAEMRKIKMGSFLPQWSSVQI